MRKMTSVAGSGSSSQKSSVHTLIRAAAVGSVVVALVLLLSKTGAGIYQRPTFLSEVKSPSAKLGDSRSTLAAVGIEPTGGRASGLMITQAQQDALKQADNYILTLIKGMSHVYEWDLPAVGEERHSKLILPELVKAVEILKVEYKKKHFVTYNPDYDTFIRNVKTALDAHQLPQRVFNEIFGNTNRVAHPSCEGTWMEFGVHTGGTITLASNWRTKYCTEKSPVVYGFDTFTGLPEPWYGHFATGVFDLKGNLPPVPANVRLVKGLFNESLPLFLKEQDASAPGGRLANLSYVHMDMDLYAGANDVFTILNDRISPGAIILFDELVNYPAYREHEMLAFWEWLGRTGRTVELDKCSQIPFGKISVDVQVIGKLGPLPHRSDAVELFPAVDLGGFQQSAAFIAL